MKLLLASRSFSNESAGKDMDSCLELDGIVQCYFPVKRARVKNAALFAAAPDMLAVLIRVLDFEQRLTACKADGGAELVSDIRAALAKAEGNQ